MKTVREVKSVYVNRYEACDGKRFDTEKECIEYESTLDTKRPLVKSIEHTTCWIPFSGWDMEPDESRLYLIKNKEEFEALKSYYSEEFVSDTGWLNTPKTYPEAYLILARECYVVGYRLDHTVIDNLINTTNLIDEYLSKAEQLKNNSNC